MIYACTNCMHVSGVLCDKNEHNAKGVVVVTILAYVLIISIVKST